MSIEGKWGYSRNGETYTGAFATREEAMQDAITAFGAERTYWIGQYRDPISPEECIEADLLIENVVCQDDYSGDWADGCLDCAKEQEQELTDMIRRAFGEWLDKHGLRPTFGIVEKAEQVTSLGSPSFFF